MVALTLPGVDDGNAVIHGDVTVGLVLALNEREQVGALPLEGNGPVNQVLLVRVSNWLFETFRGLVSRQGIPAGANNSAAFSGPGPATHTAGPHSSNLLNKADPRVDAQTGATTGNAGFNNNPGFNNNNNPNMY